jgi:hypothetical protein
MALSLVYDEAFLRKNTLQGECLGSGWLMRLEKVAGGEVYLGAKPAE